MTDDRKMWLVWKAFHDRPYAAIQYEALPQSHDGKRGLICEPRELVGQDRFLPLDALAAKYPPVTAKERK